jgi:uncharacterized Zn finger protein
VTDPLAFPRTGDPIVFPRIGRMRGAASRSSTWWGRAWVRTFEENVLEAADLLEARTLARSGRLGPVMVLAGMASTVVDRSGPTALMAQVRVEQLDGPSWQVFLDELAREAGFLPALESGELPTDLVEHADQAGVELLPAPADLETACECDAWAQPCVHALALMYQLAWHLDADPYALFLLRGRTREAILDQLAPPEDRHAQTDGGRAQDSGGRAQDSGGRAQSRPDAPARAAEILRLAADAPAGLGFADSTVAAYDDAISRLL